MSTFWEILPRFTPAAMFGALQLLAAASSPAQIPGVDFVPGRILIRSRVEVEETEVQARMRIHGIKSGRTGIRRLHVAQVPASELRGTLERLRQDPAVEYAELDGLAQVAGVSNDPLVASGQAWHLEKTKALRAWDVTRGALTLVAVLDTGIDASHPDLRDRVVDGYDFANGDADASDDSGHGTAVAGAIAACGNNQSGSAGLAYEASLLPVKVADSSGFASYSAIAEGIHYAVTRGARVINISIAGNLPSATLQNAINFARSRGALVIAASGNNGSSSPMYPACCLGVMSVGATRMDDTLAGFSNYGASLQLVAPGEEIWTTQPNISRPFAAWRGTSLASPLVAGAAALALALRPDLDPDALETLIKTSSDDLGEPGWDPFYGWGRINCAALASQLVTLPPEKPNDPPLKQDTTAPRIAVASGPAHLARVATEAAVFSGLARDDASLARIEAANGGNIFQCEGLTNWTVTVPLVPGTNWITLRALDAAGNSSTVIKRTVFHVVKAEATVVTTEGGRLVPDPTGHELEVGRAYTIRAVPAPGFVLASWGDKPADSTVLRFIMTPGLLINPVFVTNPFPAVAGSYAGLAAQVDNITTESSGYFGITVSGSGAFSGFMIMDGTRTPFTGRFRADGSATPAIRPIGKPTLSAQLKLDFNGSSIAGSISGANWVSQALGHRRVFDAIHNPAPQAGSRNFVLNVEPLQDATPAANGISRIDLNGRAIVAGRLGDSRPAFILRSVISGQGDFPLFVSMNRGSEIILGWLNFPAEAGTASGEALWLSAGTNHFATALRATGL